ncbi:hypothetical protein FXO38_13647 [Capsicum annuum]|nr:hypothetical protein FXO38_13647 [Capsicum annuum]
MSVVSGPDEGRGYGPEHGLRPVKERGLDGRWGLKLSNVLDGNWGLKPSLRGGGSGLSVVSGLVRAGPEFERGAWVVCGGLGLEHGLGRRLGSWAQRDLGWGAGVLGSACSQALAGCLGMSVVSGLDEGRGYGPEHGLRPVKERGLDGRRGLRPGWELGSQTWFEGRGFGPEVSGLVRGPVHESQAERCLMDGNWGLKPGLRREGLGLSVV